jgi:type IV pilus assembly protein PilY1
MTRNISILFGANAIRRAGTTRRAGGIGILALLCLAFASMRAVAQTPTALADQPVFSGASVPGNLALVLSVEYPTAISVANLGNYADASTYYGYFDPLKCYNYVYNFITPNQSYFQPAAFVATGTHQCSGMWSGNFMNWATMQTIDPFRWALTGGFRSVDQTAYPQTVLEKAWGAFQGATSVTGGYWNSTSFPFRGTDQMSPNNLPSALVSKVTPFSTWANFNSAIWANGNEMVFSGTFNGTQATGYYTAYGATITGGTATVTSTAASNASVYDLQNILIGANIPSQPVTFRVYVRVSVCDTSILGTAGLESNCVKYGSVYKPEGLMQKYSNQMRYAALGYLNGDGYYQEGGVLREPMGYIGPTYPVPLSSSVVTNPLAEWSSTTGIQVANPDTASAGASGVSQSGVIEYLNKFGEYTATVINGGNTNINTNTYMVDDNVSELYYAAIRYYENLGNVPQWSTPDTPSRTTAIELDGFPAVTAWTDPILYTCQKNFILGIGDDHTHYDYDVGGATASPPNATPSRPIPAAVSADTFNKAGAWTTDLQVLEGITQTPWWIYAGTGSESTYYIAGLAYGAHVQDIRPDLAGTPQTISTYWVDVEEYGYPDNLNPYYLAAKYGGFAVPSGYSLSNTTPLTLGWWDTTGNTIEMGPGLNQLQNLPDNYFPAGNAGLMVSALTSAFASISNSIQAYTTAFAFSQTTVATSGVESFAAQYSSANWTGVVTASTLVFNSDGSVNTAASTTLWTTSSTLQTQLAGTGWSTARHVVTWNGSAGVPFEAANMNATAGGAALLATLAAPSYSTSTTSAQYLNYLRGDTTNQVGSTASGSTKSLRARTLFLGDIVDASLTPVATPSQIFSQANDPGYPAFQSTWSSRPTMVYAAANDGMLHAFLGTTGVEQFAYIPSAVFAGPTATPQVNGLAALGNPSFVHHYYVDATPVAFDVDLGHTGGATGTPNWRTLLIGGLGKGGKSYYAIDVTNPASMNTEAAVAGDVKWEFTDTTMGYSFGAPVAVKTAQWGWVVALTSGYDNSDGYGYLYLVNPATGALIQKIKTPTASTGLTQASAYVKDYSDDTADSIYVGDLNGQLWRFDLTALTGAYPAPTLLATLTDASGNAQPITTAPLIEISPVTLYRYVLVGTGKLLSTTDITSANPQTFYAIIDGTEGSFNTVTTPITRANLVPVTNATVTTGVTVPSSSSGWYLDLGVSTGIAWRVVVNPVAYNGVVSFSALLTSGNACNPGGVSEVYAINYGTATSVITNTQTGSTTPLPYYSVSSAVTNLKFFTNANSANSGAQLEAGNSGGGEQNIPTSPASGIGTRLLNWREIPTAE